jgi:hypothetical protein
MATLECEKNARNIKQLGMLFQNIETNIIFELMYKL